ncbi:hypothetical protein Pelo_19716 [Pelomyxa schiedti]|nr:hypothetical protein Pelo_19716 [Pelomyxa schiedti]
MRRWPGDTGIWLDFTGEAKYRSIGNVNHVGWYVVQKEHEDFSTALKATTLKSLVEVSIVKFFDATLLTRPW